jgi:hypothetical protein
MVIERPPTVRSARPADGAIAIGVSPCSGGGQMLSPDSEILPPARETRELSKRHRRDERAVIVLAVSVTLMIGLQFLVCHSHGTAPARSRTAPGGEPMGIDVDEVIAHSSARCWLRRRQARTLSI